MEKPIATLGYALLTLLAREPQSGYDLARRLQGRIGFFWQAGHSQIYPELARLEQRGLATHRVIEQQERPDKKLYTITAAGLAALRAWVTAPAAPAPVRNELVLKAYSLWLADPAGAVALFREQARRHSEQQARYEEIQARLAERREGDGWRLDDPLFASHITLQRGIGLEREQAAWCRWVADEVERLSGEGDAAGGSVEQS
jgi:DNA-binding PadR family transcriptional regulator